MSLDLSTYRTPYIVLKRKLDTLRRAPIRVIKDKALTQAHLVVADSFKRKLRQHGVLDTIWAFLPKRSPSALPPDFSDLWFLYQTVRSRKPRIILEFGSGCSTAVLAQALSDNQALSANDGGYLYSVDADSYWAENTARSMPAHLKAFHQVIYSPLRNVAYENTLAFQHANVPDITPNLLYLDGPALTSERQVALDVLLMEERLPADFFMVIDGRKRNAEFLRRHLKRKYAVRERKFFNNRVFELVE